MNSFTFKNPQKINCYHDTAKNEAHFTVNYKFWSWTYSSESKMLLVRVVVNPTIWSSKIPNFCINVQSPAYSFDHMQSVKRKPVYKKYTNQDFEKSSNIIDLTVIKSDWSIEIFFKQEVNHCYGSEIMNIYHTIKGFWNEFKGELKHCKNFDVDNIQLMCNKINSKLITHTNDHIVITEVEEKEKCTRYKVPFYEESSDIPF